MTTTIQTISTISTPSLSSWCHAHTEEETMELISSGAVIHFEEERMKTGDAAVLTIIQTAYIFFEADRERRSERATAAYISRVENGVFIPHTHLGYHRNTFIPDDMSTVIRAMYRAVLIGLTCADIADWMNQIGVKTVRGNTFTARAVRNILQNPVYCGDVVFRKAGKTIRNHHTGLVSREVWEEAKSILLFHGSTGSGTTDAATSQSKVSATSRHEVGVGDGTGVREKAGVSMDVVIKSVEVETKTAVNTVTSTVKPSSPVEEVA